LGIRVPKTKDLSAQSLIQ